MKTCSRCKVKKNLIEFHVNKDKNSKSGYDSWCKKCREIYCKEYTKRPEVRMRDNLYHKKYRQTSHGQLNITNTRLKSYYGITLEEYNTLFIKQKGVCAICNQEETGTFKGTTKRLSVDHEHITGKIRGLLCYKCNLIIGQWADNILYFQNAIKYLKNENE